MRILIAIISLFLFSCASTPKVDIQTKPVERVPLSIPDLEPLELEPFDWIIITPENFYEKMDDLESSDINTVIFGLIDENYEVLAINFAKLRSYIESQQMIIKVYRDYYENETSEKNR